MRWNAKDRVWAAVRQVIWTRCGGRCERCGTALRWDNWDGHHRKLRSQGGQHSAANAVALCRSCHADVHATRAVGWIVARHQDPAAVPVRLWDGRMVLLDHGGGYSPVEAA